MMARTLRSLAPLLAAPLLTSCVAPDAPAGAPGPATAPAAPDEDAAYEGRPGVRGEVRRGLFKIGGQVQEQAYAVKDGLAFLDGDILVDLPGGKATDGTSQALAVTDLSQTWPNATVPYTFASNIHSNYRTMIRQALDVWEARTPVRFVERTTQADYIQFVDQDTGCYSKLGRVGGMQIINLEGTSADKDARCGNQRTVLHEAGHALGLDHEQSRADRAPVLNVMTANMDSDKRDQHQIRAELQLDGAYSFASIMHYSTFAFSSDSNPVLERRGTWSVRYGGLGSWQTLRVGPASEVSTRALLIGDLDGDGRDDAIKHDATGIYWLPRMTGAWQLRTSQSVPAGELAVGDWNNDGKDDLLTVSGGWLRVSYNGTSTFYPAAPATVPASWMRFCDFNGDGRVDAFRADNNQWQVLYSGQQSWISAGARSQPLLSLRFADLDHDGSCDVYGNLNANDPEYLMYAPGATGKIQPTPYDTATFELIEPFFPVARTIQGDFDGDGQLEVLGKRRDDADDPAFSYMLSVNAAGETYTQLARGQTPDPSYLTIADVDGDGRDDILMTGFIGTNSALATSDIDTVRKLYAPQWQVSYGGATGWNTLNLSGYAMDKAAIGDFDGNGRDDVFVLDGSKWLISWNGTSTFQHVNTSGYPLSRLRFADFNADGKTDVFLIADGKFLVSWGATTPYQQINLSNVTSVQIGDLDGDKRADVFTAWGGRWYASWGGATGWTQLNASNVTPDQVRLYDFNGDGRDDVFHATGTHWNVSYGGTTAWSTLSTSGFGYDVLRFGDFDNNGKTDVFRADGTRWLVSWNGTGAWTTRNTSGYTNLGFGDVNGDGATDVIAMHGRIVD